MQAQTRQAIEDYPLPTGQGAWQSCLHKLVLGYLVHHGYSDTAAAFAKTTSQTLEEDWVSISNRQRQYFVAHSRCCNDVCLGPLGIQDSVLRGRISEALKLVRRAYPGILDSNKQLLFKLKCRQFVEMIGGYDRIVMETVSLSCSSELGSSTDGTPPPRDVTTPPSRDPPPSLSPNANDSAGSVFDNGEVSVVTLYGGG